ncbi:MAG: tetratricopeptide repeat protein [Deltaproteobacteria bacterium]|nr:tetratricopeptide repeat protein [Deltaproteobacteria bacterium]
MKKSKKDKLKGKKNPISGAQAGQLKSSSISQPTGSDEGQAPNPVGLAAIMAPADGISVDLTADSALMASVPAPGPAGVAIRRTGQSRGPAVAAQPSQMLAGVDQAPLPVTEGDKEGTISLCMIVKNEEIMLPQCLASAKDVVDEIIVVDTGSTDRTPEIAASFGAKVYHHPWENDFSKMRNYSLSYATSDWILILDADERLEPDDHNKLRALTKLIGAAGVYFILFNQLRDKISFSKMNTIRLFRNHQGIHYEGIVHNQLIFTGPVPYSDVRMYHYGYALDNDKMDKKCARTTALLEKQLEADPNNPFIYYNLCKIKFMDNKSEESIEAARRAISLLKAQPGFDFAQSFFTDMYHTLAVALTKLNRLDEAQAALEDIIFLCPHYLDAFFDLGRLHAQAGREKEALEAYNKYFDLLERYLNKQIYLPMSVYTMENRPHALNDLGAMYHNLGELIKAREYFNKAIKANPSLPDPYYNLAMLAEKEGRVDEAAAFFERTLRLREDFLPARTKLSFLYYRLGHLVEAEDILRRGLEIHPNNHEIHNNMAGLYLKQDRLEDALEESLKSVAAMDDFAIGHLNLGLISSKQGDYPKAVIHFRRAIDLEPRNVISYINLASSFEHLGDIDLARQVYQEGLAANPNNPTLMDAFKNARCYRHVSL